MQVNYASCTLQITFFFVKFGYCHFKIFGVGLIFSSFGGQLAEVILMIILMKTGRHVLRATMNTKM